LIYADVRLNQRKDCPPVFAMEILPICQRLHKFKNPVKVQCLCPLRPIGLLEEQTLIPCSLSLYRVENHVPLLFVDSIVEKGFENTLSFLPKVLDLGRDCDLINRCGGSFPDGIVILIRNTTEKIPLPEHLAQHMVDFWF
jgi:hypothetical protein